MLDVADRVGRRIDMPQTGSMTSASTGVFGEASRWWTTRRYFTYCCGLASNFVLQLFAQK